MKKTITIMSVLLLTAATGMAQSVNVHKTDGTTVNYPAANVDYIEFIYEEYYQHCPDESHPHWIDLGLPSGTQWRCCNEGASTPEAYGGYYIFGQISSSAPSLDQIKEFLNNTTSERTTMNGVNGFKFTGPNGGMVFLPAAGHRRNLKYYNVGSEGEYWSSTPYDKDRPYYEGRAYYFYFYYDANWSYWGDKLVEKSVRPVR